MILGRASRCAEVSRSTRRRCKLQSSRWYVEGGEGRGGIENEKVNLGKGLNEIFTIFGQK